MSMSAIEFVENWVSENITADAPAPADVDATARALASQCLVAATAAGILQSEIDDSFDDLTAFMAGEIEEANTREVADDE
ncbi:MAG TPA: hypothetical protein VG291_16650 [Xanthobacteraceae bacterium]|jgi:hypothetical protein|nr:hypothetical protein [Xanthobacteraceae bacterium]